MLVYPQQNRQALGSNKKDNGLLKSIPLLAISGLFLRSAFTIFLQKVVIMSPYTGYQPLENEKSSSSVESCHTCNSAPTRYTWREKRNTTILLALLILSNLFTWFFSSQVLYDSSQLKIDPRTPYGIYSTPASTQFFLLIGPPSPHQSQSRTQRLG